MVTRGHYIYKWQDRYYVHYNNYDSYPEGLGQALISKIPSDPEDFRRWLEKKRAEYSEVEQRIFTVTLARARAGDLHTLHEIGIDCLEAYSEQFELPERPGYVDWSYTIDLDDCRFGVNGLDRAYDLNNMPDDWTEREYCHYHNGESDEGTENEDPDDSVDEQDETYRDNNRDQSDEQCVDVQVCDDLSLIHSSLDDGSYVALAPTKIRPRHQSRLNKKPAFVVSDAIFRAVQRYYCDFSEPLALEKQSICFRFREATFVLMALASCSPELVRLSTKARVYDGQSEHIALMDFNGDSSSLTSSKTEFVSALFEGYHIQGKEPGSSPSSASYWLRGVLILPIPDLTDKSSFEQAIVKAVKEGRSSGRSNFDAVAVSWTQAILIWVGGDQVQHTEQLDLGSETAFGALAHVFEAAALRELSPSTSQSVGIFSNEIYRSVIAQVDPSSRKACSTVSRAFRDYASNEFPMTNGLSLILDSKGLPTLNHITEGSLGLFRLSHITRESEEVTVLHEKYEWHPIVGFCDDTASYLPNVHVRLQRPIPRTTSHDLTSDGIEDCDPPIFNVDKLQKELSRQKFEFATSEEWKQGPCFFKSPDTYYAAFERHVPSSSVAVGPRDMLGVFTLAFFRPLKIFLGWNGNCAMKDVSKMTVNSFFLRGSSDSRIDRDKSDESMYGLVWSTHSNEDCAETWARTTEEALNRATKEYLNALYILWMWNEDYLKMDFVVMIIIGTKFIAFTRSSVTTIPPITEFPRTKASLEEENDGRFHNGDEFRFWEMAGINIESISKSVTWEPIEQSAGAQPVDVLDPHDRPRIEQMFRRMQEISIQWKYPDI